MPRNRELMRVFKDLGLVEQLGSGMSRILKSYDKSIFKISDHFIKVEFPFSIKNNKHGGHVLENDLDNVLETNENKILFLLEYNPSLSAVKLGKLIGLGDRQVRRLIQKLREEGILVRVGSDRKGYWEIRKKEQ